MGALQGTLMEVFAFVMTSLFLMDRYMLSKTINAVFRAESTFKKKRFLSSYDLVWDAYCCCVRPFRSRRVRRIQGQAERRIDRELDITFFLRKQIIVN